MGEYKAKEHTISLVHIIWGNLKQRNIQSVWIARLLSDFISTGKWITNYNIYFTI